MEKNQSSRIPMIGDTAPSFKAVTTQGEINFPQEYTGKWVVLFSYPADFTPVATTEVMIFASMTNDFKTLGMELIGLSSDSIYSHIAWLHRIKELSWKEMKHMEINFPLIADSTMEVSEKYGIRYSGFADSCCVSSVYIIDTENRIRAILHYPASVGRSPQEIKRIVTALRKAEEEYVVTPAEWAAGDDVILTTPGTWGSALERSENGNDNIYRLDWFLCFQQSNGETVEPEAVPYPSAYMTRNRIRSRR